MPNPVKHSPSPEPARESAPKTERDLDRDLDDTFPASDPVASEQRVTAKPPRRDDRTGKDHGVLPTPTDKQKALAEENRRETAPGQERRH